MMLQISIRLCQLRHPNLTCLIGYCLYEDKGFLVYEFIVNGNLGDHLYGTNHDEPLPWKQRLQICIGVACGLHYLQIGLKLNIIHCDVKPRNILLDEKLEAKLIDLGLSKLGPPSLSKALIRVRSEVVGTYRYADPEYIAIGELTDKFDVYSFGVVQLEVLCARKARDIKLTKEQKFQGKNRPAIGEVELILEHALELQERADDAARNDVDQYNYPIVEYTGSASLPESEESI
ncbi:receptor-like protein kinase THESEUS 1 [Quercus suber]|uniref:receptor-like protein kinase THESEUS 1 n=1 Tax=Quercus suber TaxID=58331 RepID=UPI0032DE859A